MGREEIKNLKKIYQVCRDTPNVNYHGEVSNEEIRTALGQDPHSRLSKYIPRNACISAIELMSAGCVVVCPNLAVLPETCANFAWDVWFCPR